MMRNFTWFVAFVLVVLLAFGPVQAQDAEGVITDMLIVDVATINMPATPQEAIWGLSTNFVRYCVDFGEGQWLYDMNNAEHRGFYKVELAHYKNLVSLDGGVSVDRLDALPVLGAGISLRIGEVLTVLEETTPIDLTWDASMPFDLKVGFGGGLDLGRCQSQSWDITGECWVFGPTITATF